MHKLPQQLQPSFEIPIILWLPSSAAQSCKFCVHKCTNTHTHKHCALCAHTRSIRQGLCLSKKVTQEICGGRVCVLLEVWQQDNKLFTTKVTVVCALIVCGHLSLIFSLSCKAKDIKKVKTRWTHAEKSFSSFSVLSGFIWNEKKKTRLIYVRVCVCFWAWTRKVNMAMSHNPLLLHIVWNFDTEMQKGHSTGSSEFPTRFHMCFSAVSPRFQILLYSIHSWHGNKNTYSSESPFKTNEMWAKSTTQHWAGFFFQLVGLRPDLSHHSLLFCCQSSCGDILTGPSTVKLTLSLCQDLNRLIA